MLTTPNYGLEYAEGDDPAKNYPAVVDGPSKAKIDTALKANADLLAKTGLSGKRLAAGTAVLPISGSGGITIPFGYTFASPPVVTSCIVGDENSNYAFIQPVQASVTTVQFQARVYKHDGTIPTSGTVRVNWSVIGTAV